MWMSQLKGMLLDLHTLRQAQLDDLKEPDDLLSTASCKTEVCASSDHILLYARIIGGDALVWVCMDCYDMLLALCGIELTCPEKY